MPQRNGHEGFDAIVAGGGVIGLACAWRLAGRGARVAVVDGEQPPAGATRVAAGMLAPVGEVTFGEESLLAMALGSARAYPDFTRELAEAGGVDPGYSACGALHVALDRDEAGELRRRHRLQEGEGLEARWLGPRACRDLEPGLAPSLHGGVHAPGDAAVDPRALTAALLAALGEAGAELRFGEEAVSPLIEAGRVVGLLTSAGELRAGAVVAATGCRWDWLPASARPPIRPVKGQALELRGTTSPPACERILASERVYLVPRSDGRLVVGATTEERGFETTVTAGGVHELLREACRLLPDVAEMELVEAAAGLRPATPDNLPIVGAGLLDGLFLATGHYRNGILLAPLTADAVARAVSGEGPAQTMDAAAPHRFRAAEAAGVDA